MKILIIGDFTHIYNQNLIEDLLIKEKKSDIYFVNTNPNSKNNFINPNVIVINTFVPKWIKKTPVLYQIYFHFYALSKSINQSLKFDYNIINIQSALFSIGLYINRLKKKNNNIVLSFWGSEIKNLKKWQSILQKKLILQSSSYSFSVESMATQVINLYKIDKNKVFLIGRESKALTQILNNTNCDKNTAKNHFGIPSKKIVITCGYNGNLEYKHLDIIRQIKRFKPEILSNIFLLFPITYGRLETKIEVENELQDSGIDFLIIKDFLDIPNLVKLRTCSDIMINLPEFDQLANALLEYTSAENIIITGKWLPYEILDQYKIHINRISNINALGNAIKNVLENYKTEIIDIQNNKKNLRLMLNDLFKTMDWYSFLKSTEK